jgi:XTP/dITP diphosphohydrolase
MKICFASRNLHKIEEIRSQLPEGFEVKGLQDIGCDTDIPEPFPTLEENALAKARFVFQQYSIACFADDSGLEVDALQGAPGVRSARYAGEHGNHQANMQLLLQQLEGQSNRKAQFRTVIAWIDTQGNEIMFEGICHGHIGHEQLGDQGFGYDPIFFPLGHNQTFAQMTLPEKNTLSHRAIAFQKFLQFLRQ